MPKFRENPSLTTPTTQNLSSAFNLCEFVPTCKKSGYLTDFFWRYGWLKNPAFWLAENILAHISGTKIWDLCRNTANNINFHYRSNSVKMMTKFSNKLKKKPVLDHFPNFGGKIFSPGKSISVTHNFTWHSSTMPKFRKNLCHNSKKMPRQMEGQNDRQTLFYRTLPATASEITSFLK